MIDLIQQRLDRYRAADALEEQQAVKEILQEVALYALWRAKFFEVAAFQGGTSLRILHKLPRFSEDLDFILCKPDPAFQWTPYAKSMQTVLREFGLKSEILDKPRMDANVRQAVLKDDSISRQLNLQFYSGGAGAVPKIKLEIDVNPPAGSGFAFSYLDFPLDYEICHQDLPSNFALKIHALLRRPYVKGRDWYDFTWYLRRRVAPNFQHLQSALEQHGPWKDQSVVVTSEWLKLALHQRVAAIDWREAAQDVERFLSKVERESLSLWNERFFSAKVNQLVEAAA